MICEHKLKFEEMKWDGRKRSSKWQTPTKAIFYCVECKSRMVFGYIKEAYYGEEM